jgi:energy-coupling factor transporter transmembrane protein EcfT
MGNAVRNAFETMLAGIFIMLFVALMVGLPTMFLWNWLMPIIFGLTRITFWQAVGVNLLSTVLFKSSKSSKDKDN